MPPILVLTAAERAALEQVRARSPKPFCRERAAALLQLAAGHAPTTVARTGLLKPRHPQTVRAWLAAYTTTGLAGVMAQRPRRRAFSP